MSADLSFQVKINGSEEDISEAVRIIQQYEDTDESSKERKWDLDCINCYYRQADSVDIEAMGPYGYYDLEDIDIFQELAKQVPGCSFTGSIGGFSGSEALMTQAEYKDRHLVLKYKSIFERGASDEELDEFWHGDSWDRIKEYSITDQIDENGLISIRVERINNKRTKKR